MAAKKNTKTTTADAVAKFKTAQQDWLNTRSVPMTSEEDIARGCEMELGHDFGPFPAKEGETLAEACRVLAKHGRRAKLDVQPTLRVAIALQRCGYPTDEMLDEAEALAVALATVPVATPGEKRDTDAVDQRRTERRAQIMKVVQASPRSKSIAALLLRLRGASLPISRDTLRRDLLAMVEDGTAKPGELPPLGRKHE